MKVQNTNNYEKGQRNEIDDASNNTAECQSLDNQKEMEDEDVPEQPTSIPDVWTSRHALAVLLFVAFVPEAQTMDPLSLLEEITQPEMTDRMKGLLHRLCILSGRRIPPTALERTLGRVLDDRVAERVILFGEDAPNPFGVDATDGWKRLSLDQRVAVLRLLIGMVSTVHSGVRKTIEGFAAAGNAKQPQSPIFVCPPPMQPLWAAKDGHERLWLLCTSGQQDLTRFLLVCENQTSSQLRFVARDEESLSKYVDELATEAIEPLTEEEQRLNVLSALLERVTRETKKKERSQRQMQRVNALRAEAASLQVSSSRRSRRPVRYFDDDYVLDSPVGPKDQVLTRAERLQVRNQRRVERQPTNSTSQVDPLKEAQSVSLPDVKAASQAVGQDATIDVAKDAQDVGPEIKREDRQGAPWGTALPFHAPKLEDFQDHQQYIASLKDNRPVKPQTWPAAMPMEHPIIEPQEFSPTQSSQVQPHLLPSAAAVPAWPVIPEEQQMFSQMPQQQPICPFFGLPKPPFVPMMDGTHMPYAGGPVMASRTDSVMALQALWSGWTPQAQPRKRGRPKGSKDTRPRLRPGEKAAQKAAIRNDMQQQQPGSGGRVAVPAAFGQIAPAVGAHRLPSMYQHPGTFHFPADENRSGNIPNGHSLQPNPLGGLFFPGVPRADGFLSPAEDVRVRPGDQEYTRNFEGLLPSKTPSDSDGSPSRVDGTAPSWTPQLSGGTVCPREPNTRKDHGPSLALPGSEGGQNAASTEPMRMGVEGPCSANDVENTPIGNRETGSFDCLSPTKKRRTHALFDEVYHGRMCDLSPRTSSSSVPRSRYCAMVPQRRPAISGVWDDPCEMLHRTAFGSYEGVPIGNAGSTECFDGGGLVHCHSLQGLNQRADYEVKVTQRSPFIGSSTASGTAPSTPTSPNSSDWSVGSPVNEALSPLPGDTGDHSEVDVRDAHSGVMQSARVQLMLSCLPEVVADSQQQCPYKGRGKTYSRTVPDTSIVSFYDQRPQHCPYVTSDGSARCIRSWSQVSTDSESARLEPFEHSESTREEADEEVVTATTSALRYLSRQNRLRSGPEALEPSAFETVEEWLQESYDYAAVDQQADCSALRDQGGPRNPAAEGCGREPQEEDFQYGASRRVLVESNEGGYHCSESVPSLSAPHEDSLDTISSSAAMDDDDSAVENVSAVNANEPPVEQMDDFGGTATTCIPALSDPCHFVHRSCEMDDREIRWFPPLCSQSEISSTSSFGSSHPSQDFSDEASPFAVGYNDSGEQQCTIGPQIPSEVQSLLRTDMSPRKRRKLTNVTRDSCSQLQSAMCPACPSICPNFGPSGGYYQGMVDLPAAEISHRVPVNCQIGSSHLSPVEERTHVTQVPPDMLTVVMEPTTDCVVGRNPHCETGTGFLLEGSVEALHPGEQPAIPPSPCLTFTPWPRLVRPLYFEKVLPSAAVRGFQTAVGGGGASTSHSQASAPPWLPSTQFTIVIHPRHERIGFHNTAPCQKDDIMGRNVIEYFGDTSSGLYSTCRCPPFALQTYGGMHPAACPTGNPEPPVLYVDGSEMQQEMMAASAAKASWSEGVALCGSSTPLNHWSSCQVHPSTTIPFSPRGCTGTVEDYGGLWQECASSDALPTTGDGGPNLLYQRHDRQAEISHYQTEMDYGSSPPAKFHSISQYEPKTYAHERSTTQSCPSPLMSQPRAAFGPSSLLKEALRICYSSIWRKCSRDQVW